MATLLLPNSCRYLLDHPDHGGGKGAGVMLRAQHLLAAGVAAKGASPAYERRGAGGATPCPGLKTLWRGVQEPHPPLCRRN